MTELTTVETEELDLRGGERLKVSLWRDEAGEPIHLVLVRGFRGELQIPQRRPGTQVTVPADSLDELRDAIDSLTGDTP